MNSKSILRSLSLLLPCTFVSAQVIDSGFTLHPGDAALPYGFYGRTGCADLNVDGLPDLVVEAGGDCLVYFSPGKTIAKSSAFRDCIDFDIMPAGGAGLTAPSIICLRADGLRHVFIDSANDWATLDLVNAPIGAGSLVRVRDIDHDGSPDIVVYESNTRIFSVFTYGANGWAPVRTPFVVPDDVLDFVVFDSLGDGSLCALGVMTQNGLAVMNVLGGYVAASSDTTWNSDCICVVSAPNAGTKEWVAWARTEDPGTANEQQHLYIARRQIDHIERIPDHARTVAMNAGDVGFGGTEGLVMNIGATWTVGIATNTGTTRPNYNLATQIDLHGIPGFSHDPQYENAFNRARPAICDVEADTDLDILVPIEASTESSAANTSKNIYIRRSTVVDETAQQVQLFQAAQAPAEFTLVYDSAGVENTRMRLQVVAPDLSSTSLPFGNATHVELTVWQKPDTASDVQSAPLPGYPRVHDLNTAPNAPNLYDFEVDLGYIGVNSDAVWMVSLRLVTLVDNKVSAVYPANNFALASFDEGTAMETWLQDFGLDGAAWILCDKIDNPSSATSFLGGGDSGDPGHGGLPVECLGEYPDDIPPPPDDPKDEDSNG